MDEIVIRMVGSKLVVEVSLAKVLEAVAANGKLALEITSAQVIQAVRDAAAKPPVAHIVLFGPMRGNDLPRIVEFVTHNRLPAVFELGQGVRGGGLMEFGPSRPDLARHIGAYIDKIANGARPADLPVEEPTRFELIVNLKAARTMGLTIPPSLLLRADQVIQ